MPRQHRIEYPGATYHVMARGNRRETIFRDDPDCRAFLDRLDKACDRTGWQIRAFVLMNNHYHLVLHTPEGNLVDGMRWLQNAYTRYFNQRHQLWGRLFGDRYKAVLVEESHSFGGRVRATPDYLATLIDYVHLNPARARIVRPGEKQSLLDYPWSSIALGYGLAPKKRKKWMDVATGLSLTQCRDTVAGRREYVERLDQRALLEQTEGERENQSTEVENTLRRGWYWGSQAFGEWLIDKIGAKAVSNADYRASSLGIDHAEIAASRWIEAGCKELKLDRETELRTPQRGDLRRAAIAWAIWKKTSVSQDWIAEKLGMKSRQNVSQQIRRFEKLMEKDLPRELKKWKQKLTIID
jgi:putative transposase